MNPHLLKLIRHKATLKVLVTLGAVFVLGGLYYALFYMDVVDQIASTQVRQRALEDEKAEYLKRKAEYVAYRDQLRKLQDEQREALKELPKKAELPSFIASIQEQADLSGLETLKITVDAERPEEGLYMKIPIQMEVRGSYHSVTKFFKNVSELRRIVTIEDLGLAVDRVGGTNVAPKLLATFTAVTFRYLEKTGGPV
jgi:type IV pilus assembly protein PilO